MEEIKQINQSNTVISIDNSFHKVFKSIKSKKGENIDVELDFLKKSYNSDNLRVSHAACHTLQDLVASNLLDPGAVLNILMTLIQNSKFDNYTITTDTVLDILLIDLKRKITAMSDKQVYICPFQLSNPQHPILFLLPENDPEKMMYLKSKVIAMLNHSDKHISRNIVEFLRPFILFLFCNRTIYPESSMIFQNLLQVATPSSDNLEFEILAMAKFSSKSTCFFLNDLLIISLNRTLLTKSNSSSDLTIYLVAITKNMLMHQLDPRSNLSLIAKALAVSEDKNGWNIILILLAEMLGFCSIRYVPDIVRLIKIIVLDHHIGNRIILHMIQDGIIQCLASSAINLDMTEALLTYISTYKVSEDITKSSKLQSKVVYFHPDIARAQDVCRWLDSCNLKVEEIKTSGDQLFWQKNVLLLRGLFLSTQLEFSDWKQVLIILMEVSSKNKFNKNQIVMPLLYKLANDTHPPTKLHVLQNMVALGAKDKIFNTLKAISKGLVKTFSVDLYLRLWKVESRTYPFLHKILLETDKDENDDKELDIMKAYAIKEICKIRPQQHGADLIVSLSDILNRSFDANGEIAASLVLDAICMLCENHVINAVSTWKAIGFKLRFEKRIRVIESLSKFFELVPLLRSPSVEYDKLYKEILEKLWEMITLNSDKRIIGFALKALQNYKQDDMTLADIPELYREGFVIADPLQESEVGVVCVLDMEIPGDCYMQLLSKINMNATEKAADLLSHYIALEIDGFRQGVYAVPENQAEPINLKTFSKKSVLKAVVHHLIHEATKTNKRNCTANEIIKNINCLRILSIRYSKPLPPLNWCFLHEFIHQDFEMKNFCIKIASKQQIISGTAKRLVDNFLLNVDCSCEDDILLGYEILVDLLQTGTTEVLRTFLQTTLNIAFGLLSNEKHYKNSLLCKLLALIKETDTLVSKSEIIFEDNFLILSSVLEEFLDKVAVDSTEFFDFLNAICSMPPKFIYELTSSKETSSNKLRKNIIIRCKALTMYKKVENSLNWINTLLDSIFDCKSEQQTFFQHFAILMGTNDNFPKKLWIVDLIGNIQTKLTQNKSLEFCEFLLELLILSIELASGYSNICTQKIYLNKIFRHEQFPQSLQLLGEQLLWEESMGKIFEFFYYIFFYPDISDQIKETIKNALICNRNHSYLFKTKVWTKFISLRN